jgi:hypothetical protein
MHSLKIYNCIFQSIILNHRLRLGKSVVHNVEKSKSHVREKQFLSAIHKRGELVTTGCRTTNRRDLSLFNLVYYQNKWQTTTDVIRT